MKLYKKIICISMILILILAVSSTISFAALNQEIANIIEAYYEWTASDECKFDENGQVDESAAATKLVNLCNKDLDKLNSLYATYTNNNLKEFLPSNSYGANYGWPGGDTTNVICKAVSRAINNAKGGTTNNNDKNQQEKDKEEIKKYYKEAVNAGNNVTKTQLKKVDTLIKEYVTSYGQLRNETDQDIIGWAQWVNNKLKDMGDTEESAYEQYTGEHQQRQENNEEAASSSKPNTGVLGQSSANGSHTVDEVLNEGQSFIDAGKNEGSKIDSTNLQAASNTLYNMLLAIGIVIAVIVGMYLGVKFMFSSAEDKAKVKESLIPYIAGCVVIFGAFIIWKLAILLLGGIA